MLDTWAKEFFKTKGLFGSCFKVECGRFFKTTQQIRKRYSI